MAYGNTTEVYADNQAKTGRIYQMHSGMMPPQAELLSSLQYLHASLEPKDVFDTFAALAGKQLPLSGLQLSFNDTLLEWGEQGSVVLPRPFVWGAQTGILKYYLYQPVSASQMRFMTQLEFLLQQPMSNALVFAEISRQATVDSLTGLGNRRDFERTVNQAICRAARSESPMSLLILDLDNFKQLNDNYGHETGDLVLTEFGKLLQTTIRSSDQAFRLGGDEFVILVEGDRQGCALLCERIMARLQSHRVLSGYQVSASLGGTQYKINDDLSSMYRSADKALYKAKKAGRNGYRLAG
ncbi:GGDEF domain-containing protein [Shewanella submarina]|uniref:diguanylate cyclase n=1 Tax=Shewanella submarina TaxID=2016376 RepID=A0ABV7GK85_9GAMM|nr:GGDEF domain-containing protein [Shewanella submarina]MCL1036379.1 GGDEF domain-containing protein [Shewanella submarina]